MDQPGHTDATDEEPSYDDTDMTNEEFEQRIANAIPASLPAVVVAAPSPNAGSITTTLTPIMVTTPVVHVVAASPVSLPA